MPKKLIGKYFITLWYRTLAYLMLKDLYMNCHELLQTLEMIKTEIKLRWTDGILSNNQDLSKQVRVLGAVTYGQS